MRRITCSDCVLECHVFKLKNISHQNKPSSKWELLNVNKTTIDSLLSWNYITMCYCTTSPIISTNSRRKKVNKAHKSVEGFLLIFIKPHPLWHTVLRVTGKWFAIAVFQHGPVWVNELGAVCLVGFRSIYLSDRLEAIWLNTYFMVSPVCVY